jgi:sugar phosphate isomerase/epimerase
VIEMVLSRRVEVLFDEGEYEALRREAARRGVSVGELLREAVRRAYLRPSEEERRAAIQRILNDPRYHLDIGSWEEAKKLIGRWVDKEP